MRRIHELLLLHSSVAVMVMGWWLNPAKVNAAELDEAKVQAMLLQRFDENRNDKLELGEARQARARLRNLLEDKSEREINIQTWRDDLRELLQALDQNQDNRLTVSERDDGRDLLDRLIPSVDPNVLKERTASTSSGSANRTGDQVRRADRATSGNSGSHVGSFGSALGGGGFGNFGGGQLSSGGNTRSSSGVTSEVVAGSAWATSGGSQIRPGMGDPGIAVSHAVVGATSALGNGTNSRNTIAGTVSGSGVDPNPSSSTAPAGTSTTQGPASSDLGSGLAAPTNGVVGGIKTVPPNPKPNF